MPHEVTTLKDIEIFRAGDYPDKKIKLSEADIAALAADYNESVSPAPVTTDHAQSGEALGWIESVYVRGSVLMATLTKVPVEFAETLKAGRFRTRSIEIWRNFETTGRPYIKAISFLGAAAPRIIGLADMELPSSFACDEAAFASIDFSTAKPEPKPEPTPAGTSELFSKSELEPEAKQEPDAMPKPEDKTTDRPDAPTVAQFDELKGDVLKLTTDLEASNKKNVDLAAQLSASETARFIETRMERAKAAMEAAIIDFRVLPHQKDALMALFAGAEKDGKGGILAAAVSAGAQTVKFSGSEHELVAGWFGDIAARKPHPISEVSDEDRDAVKELAKEKARVVQMSHSLPNSEDAKASEQAVNFHAAEAKAKEDGISYEDALIEVSP